MIPLDSYQAHYGLHSDKCTDCDSCHSDQLIFRCFECKKNDKNDLNNKLIKRFANIYEFCHEDINKFILLLRKGVYSYEYMECGKDLTKHHCPIKKLFIVV